MKREKLLRKVVLKVGIHDPAFPPDFVISRLPIAKIVVLQEC